MILQLDEVEYVNAKRVNESAPGFVFSQKFKQKVNFDYSSVHIPVEIYEGGKETKNALLCSHFLRIFKKCLIAVEQPWIWIWIRNALSMRRDVVW